MSTSDSTSPRPGPGLHRQRRWILVGAAILLGGYTLPWAHLGDTTMRGWDHPWLSPVFLAALIGLVLVASVGARRQRLTGAARGLLLLFALLIAALAAFLAYALTSSILAFRLDWGIFVTLVGCVWCITSASLVGAAELVDPTEDPAH